MNRKYLTILSITIAVTTVFLLMPTNEPSTPLKQTSTKEQTQQTHHRPQSTISDNQHKNFTQRLPKPSPASYQTRQPKLTPEQAIKQFHQTRNHLKADPTVSEAERIKTLEHLALALWGKDAVIPEETEQDRQQQQLIKEQIIMFKQNIKGIQQDNSLSQKDKAIAIKKIYIDFVNSPN